MVLLESRVHVLDPERRFLTLEQMIGPTDIPPRDWHRTDDGLIEMSFSCAWISVHGPGRVLDKLNQLRMVDSRTRQPFVIISQAEYLRQIANSCVIL